MKLLPKARTDVRVNTEDSLGHGMDAVIVMVLFLAAGFGLDRLFDTMPIFMVVMTVLGAVGLFAKFKYRYDARMDEHDAQRLAKLGGPVRVEAPAEDQPDVPRQVATDSADPGRGGA